MMSCWWDKSGTQQFYQYILTVKGTSYSTSWWHKLLCGSDICKWKGYTCISEISSSPYQQNKCRNLFEASSSANSPSEELNINTVSQQQDKYLAECRERFKREQRPIYIKLLENAEDGLHKMFKNYCMYWKFKSCPALNRLRSEVLELWGIIETLKYWSVRAMAYWSLEAVVSQHSRAEILSVAFDYSTEAVKWWNTPGTFLHRTIPILWEVQSLLKMIGKNSFHSLF